MSLRATTILVTVFAAGAVQAQPQRTPVVPPAPGAPKPTLIVTEPEAEGLPPDAQKAVTRAASTFARGVEGARYEVTSFAASASVTGCADVNADCVKLIAKTFDALQLARVEAVAGKNEITLVVTLYDGASGNALKKATRATAAAGAGEAATSALEEATGKKMVAAAAAPPAPKGARTIEAYTPPAEGTPAAAASAEAQAGAPKRSPLRLFAAFGLGRAAESGAPKGADVAQAELGASFTLVEHLLLALQLGQQIYDRHYLTALPAADGTGSLDVDVHERLLDVRLCAGYNLLRFAVPDSQKASVAPFAEFRFVRYENNVAPQTLLTAGAGLRAAVRVSEALSIEGEYVYGFNALPYMSAALKKEITDLLAFGNVIGSMRYGGGIAYDFTPRVRGTLHYGGEWLGLEHASRFTDTLQLGVTVDL